MEDHRRMEAWKTLAVVHWRRPLAVVVHASIGGGRPLASIGGCLLVFLIEQ